jgi:DNA mismatch endonuclease, patch repair protein
MSSLPAPDSRVSRRMANTRGRDNPREIEFRSMLHWRGLRFRIHVRLTPGSRRTADVVFPRQRIAVYLDGCFWHGCPLHGTWPKANAEWWRTKIEENRRRDQDTNQRLMAAGWRVMRIWEHEALSDAACRIEAIIRRGEPSLDFSGS